MGTQRFSRELIVKEGTSTDKWEEGQQAVVGMNARREVVGERASNVVAGGVMGYKAERKKGKYPIEWSLKVPDAA